MKMEKESQEKLQELQILEQTLQQVMLQKQAFQLELNETESALSEIEKTSEDVYRIIGNVMLKTGKSEISKELKEKKDILSLRLKSLEKQEESLKGKSNIMREEFMKSMKK